MKRSMMNFARLEGEKIDFVLVAGIEKLEEEDSPANATKWQRWERGVSPATPQSGWEEATFTRIWLRRGADASFPSLLLGGVAGLAPNANSFENRAYKIPGCRAFGRASFGRIEVATAKKERPFDTVCDTMRPKDARPKARQPGILYARFSPFATTSRLVLPICVALIAARPSPANAQFVKDSAIAAAQKAAAEKAAADAAAQAAKAAATPTPTATPEAQNPITSPNTNVPAATPAPGLPADNQPASAAPADQNRQFDNPNRVLPAPPITPIGAPNRPAEVASSTPNGPIATPTPTPGSTPLPGATPTPPNLAVPGGVAPNPTTPGATTPGATTPDDGEIQSGDEGANGDYSLEVPDSDHLIVDVERGLTISQGPVTLRYREFSVRGDRGLLEEKADPTSPGGTSRRAILAGNLTVSVRGQTFSGKSLTIDLNSGRWTLSSLNATFPPDVFPPGAVLAPIYLTDGTVAGTEDTLGGQNFKITSCDRNHYYIQSKRLDFYRTPNGDPSRIVLRRNAIYLLGRRIVPLPIYVISLLSGQTRRQPLQATFGQNTTDGYFVRGLYDLRADTKSSDALLIDALQKRGLGLGFQREYAATAGILYLYALNGREGGREVDTRINRTYNLTGRIVSNIRLDSTQTNALTGETVTSQNGQFSFGRTGAAAQTNALFSFNRSSFGFGESTNGSITLDHRQNFGSGYTLEATALLNRSQSGDGQGGQTNDNATADQTFVVGKNAKAFDVFLRSELHNDLVEHRTYQLERLPQLTLQSSTDRLGLPGFKRLLPGNFSLDLGRFSEPRFGQNGQADALTKERANFFFTPNDRRVRLFGRGTSRSALNASGNFEQAFYSDDTARYNYSYFLSSTNTIGPAQLLINYNKQRTFGFTPFQFDFSTPGENVDYTLSLGQSERFRFNLTGGRDIENGYSRDLIARAQFQPNAAFYASLGTSFQLQKDLNTDGGTKFGDIYANVRIARNPNRFGGGQFAFGVRYSPNGQGIARANGSIDINLGRKLRVQGLAGYDGFSKTFDFTQIRFTQDLHCFNLYATYDGQRKELRFDLALKAFPFADTRFGRSQFSEGFDPSVGGIQ